MLHSALIVIVPVPDVSLDIQTVSLPYEFFNCFSEAAPKYQIVPIGPFRDLSAVLGNISPFGSGQRKICNTNVIVKISHIGILAHVSNQNNFVY